MTSGNVDDPVERAPEACRRAARLAPRRGVHDALAGTTSYGMPKPSRYFATGILW